MIVVGVCALPAGGKSAVSAILQRLGAVWINADEIAHQVLATPAAIEQIVRRFGTTVLGPDGEIDRPQLGRLVFGDDAAGHMALRYLESIVHPLTGREIRQRIAVAIQDNSPAVVLDIPLLFESGWDVWCDEIWFVDTPREIILEAALRRGWSESAWQQRVDRQLNPDVKGRLSTRRLENHRSLDDLEASVRAWWRAAMATAGQTPSAIGTSPSHCHSFPIDAP